MAIAARDAKNNKKTSRNKIKLTKKHKIWISVCAGVLAIALSESRKYLIPGIPFVALMCISRNYLMAHYPTGVLAGTLVGAISAVIAYFIAKLIFVFLKKHRKNKLFGFILDFDIRTIFNKRKD